jgi:hypothetical protein
MNIWNVDKVIEKIKQKKITVSESVGYLISICFLAIAHLSPFNFLPTAYLLTMIPIKKYLEQEAKPAQLPIDIFSDSEHIFFWALIVISLVGFFLCWIACRNSLKQCMYSMWCITLPLWVRILVVTAILYALTISTCSVYFITKLQAIEQTKVTLKDPLTFLPHFLVHALWKGAQSYKTAQTIYAQISITSYYLYLATHIGALISSLWYFMRLYHALRRVK